MPNKTEIRVRSTNSTGNPCIRTALVDANDDPDQEIEAAEAVLSLEITESNLISRRTVRPGTNAVTGEPATLEDHTVRLRDLHTTSRGLK